RAPTSATRRENREGGARLERWPVLLRGKRSPDRQSPSYDRKLTADSTSDRASGHPWSCAQSGWYTGFSQRGLDYRDNGAFGHDRLRLGIALNGRHDLPELADELRSDHVQLRIVECDSPADAGGTCHLHLHLPCRKTHDTPLDQVPFSGRGIVNPP